jgi:adenylate kinase family enzyme
MPLLGVADPLPSPARAVLVAGPSGAGKTTLAIRLAGQFGLQHTEIDGLFHGPRWTERPDFVADVDRFSATPGWITEWLYGSVRPMLLERADLLVWLDLPRRTVMRQVIGRTIRRRRQREELWNGNYEGSLWRIFTDRDHIVRWAWNSYRRANRGVLEAVRDRPDLAVVRLRSHSEITAWLAGPVRVGADPPQP